EKARGRLNSARLRLGTIPAALTADAPRFGTRSPALLNNIREEIACRSYPCWCCACRELVWTTGTGPVVTTRRVTAHRSFVIAGLVPAIHGHSPTLRVIPAKAGAHPEMPQRPPDGSASTSGWIPA